MNDSRDLAALIRARVPIIVIETLEEQRALRLLAGIAEERRLPLYRWSAAGGLVHTNFRYGGATPGTEPAAPADAREWRIDDTASLKAALTHIDSRGQPGLYVLLDIHPYLEDPVAVRLLREIALDHPVDGRSLVLVSPALTLPAKLARHAARLSLPLPDEARIRQLLDSEFQLFERQNGRPVRRERAVEDAMVRYVNGLCEEDVRHQLRLAVRDDGALTREDLQRAAAYKQQSLPGLSLEVVLDNTDAIGGMLRLRRWLAQRRPVFLGEVERTGLPVPRGVLIAGVQGTGKSLAAKATAAAWGVPLLRLDFGALYDKFQGETERKLRAALRAAEGMQPVVLWIDEIEKSLASGSAEHDGGVSRRVLGTLLTWMAERTARVFIVATANEVRELPPELVRKGRFDELFFVDLPDAPARETIFRIHLNRQRLPLAEFDLRSLANHSKGMSGAEIEQAVVSAIYEALPAGREPDMTMLLTELARTRPLSVVMAERVAALRAWAHERCVMAD